MDNEIVQSPEIPSLLPLLPVRDVVVFPYMILPLFVGREQSIAAVDAALASNRMVFLNTQVDAEIQDPAPDDLYEVGTVALIMRMLKTQDGRVKVLVQGLGRAKRVSLDDTGEAVIANIEQLDEQTVSTEDLEAEALVRSLRERVEEVVELGRGFPSEIMMVLENIGDVGRLADIVAANLSLKVSDANVVLSTLDAKARLRRVLEFLSKEKQVLEVQATIKDAAQEEISKTQREYLLKQQLKAIQEELGVSNQEEQDIRDLEERIEAAKLTKEAREVAEKELKRLKTMSTSSAEASVIRTYIEWLADLPWKKTTRDNLDLMRARKVLDDDHYDLEKVKDRILEHLAVRKLRPEAKGVILCFVGPPGVGKTSLGQSIARAMGRKFARISLGGVRDEAEIRGHRRTYVGAMPGRIIQSMKKAGVRNPVFMFDEIDKIGQDFRGDPASALLEVLDPAQNNTFEDHYLNIPFDLSKVMFICTANHPDPIPPALMDRMEVIRLSGYTREDKLRIARKYIIPRQLKEQGLTDALIDISDSAVGAITDSYTREAGLRNLEREVANLCRKVARKVAEGSEKLFKITKRNVARFLGPARYMRETELEADQVGVVTGLAWTQVGGEILRVEVTTMPGQQKLILTGQLGNVMKESAQAALSWARSRAEKLGIDEAAIGKREIHVHVPAGATPKDGPSAGITMATALVSALTEREVDSSIAMTGEITLRGRVLPIGGVKEKVLAATMAGVKKVVLPARNKKDVDALTPKIRRSMEFVFVDSVDEVIELALKPAPKKHVQKKSVEAGEKTAGSGEAKRR